MPLLKFNKRKREIIFKPKKDRSLNKEDKNKLNKDKKKRKTKINPNKDKDKNKDRANRIKKWKRNP